MKVCLRPPQIFAGFGAIFWLLPGLDKGNDVGIFLLISGWVGAWKKWLTGVLCNSVGLVFEGDLLQI